MLPTISVIIPTYNRASLLKEALDSVLAQTYTDYEVIVIDDGSTDNTEEMMQAFLTDSRIRYIKQSNAGVSAARNHGIFEARGEWIAFLDSDDLWFPEKLEKQMAFLTEHPTAGAVCGPSYQYQDGRVVKDKNGEMVLGWDREETLELTFVLFAENCGVNASSVLVRKAVLHKAGLFDSSLKIGEDIDLWFRVARYTEFWYYNEAMGHCRKHESNTTAVDPECNLFFDIQLREIQRIRWHDQPQIVKIYERSICELSSELADRARQRQDYKEAARFFWVVVRYAPDLKVKSIFFTKNLIAKFLPLVFRIWDKRH